MKDKNITTKIASELNQLFKKSTIEKKRISNQEQIEQILPKLSLDSFLNDERESKKSEPLKMPKISLLKSKGEKIST